MKDYVLKYLTNCFVVDNPWSTIDIVCHINTIEICYFNNLVEELKCVFGLSSGLTKDIIFEWSKTEHPLINLEEYFKLKENYVWSPYVPMLEPPIIMGIDPINDFNPPQTLMSRYATTRVNENFYGIIRGDI